MHNDCYLISVDDWDVYSEHFDRVSITFNSLFIHWVRLPCFWRWADSCYEARMIHSLQRPQQSQLYLVYRLHVVQTVLSWVVN